METAAPFSLQTLESFEREIDGVAQAIEMIDAGTYGTCEECGASIRREMLAADPLLVRCDAHQVRSRPALFIESDAAPGSVEPVGSAR